MTRVLYIGVGQPWAGGAGYLVRQNLFLRALADAADELHLALFDLPTDGTGTPPPPPAFASATAVPRPRRRPASRLRSYLDDRRSPVPRMFRGYDLTAPRAAIAALAPDRFDAVFAYRIDFAHFAGVLGCRRLILDIDDPEHLRWGRRLSILPNGGDPRSQADLLKLEQFERAAEANAALAFVCQANDADGWPVPPEVVPNTVPLPPAPQRRPTKPVVLFVGNCAGDDELTPNVDAVRHFLADVWPAVRTAVPGAEFHLVGATGDAVRRAVAAAGPGVVVRGFVRDLAAVYAEAAVSVAPIRYGTGTRIKVLEAFAHACPVLSTPLGIEGIPAIVGLDYEMAVFPADFARRCVELLTDTPAAERIGAAGRALVEQHYDADAQRHQLADRLRRFVHHHG